METLTSKNRIIQIYRPKNPWFFNGSKSDKDFHGFIVFL